LRIAPILAGYRGQPATDREAIVAAVRAVQAYVTQNAAHVQEVEINPLICTPTRAVVADALIRTGDTV
jgi:acetyl-CoA synthetase